ncbi:hypothetical protein VTI74DRAFT_6601 [Chaetomium olivicolor]
MSTAAPWPEAGTVSAFTQYANDCQLSSQIKQPAFAQLMWTHRLIHQGCNSANLETASPAASPFSHLVSPASANGSGAPSLPDTPPSVLSRRQPYAVRNLAQRQPPSSHTTSIPVPHRRPH